MQDPGPDRRVTTVALLAWGAAWTTGQALLFALPTAIAITTEHRRLRAGRPATDADRVTFVRLGVILLLAAGVLRQTPSLNVLLALGVLALDGLDGWIARQRGCSTAAGAWLDGESDAAFIATVSLCAHLQLGLPAWVLLPGLARYLYVASLWRWPARGPVPRSRWGRASFVATAASLATLPMLPSPAREGVALLAVVNTGASFARSFAWSYRSRPEA